MYNNKILIIGALGQIGSELTFKLANIYGESKILASDIKVTNKKRFGNIKYLHLDILDRKSLFNLVKKYNINEIYLLAASLSYRAEKNIYESWLLNTNSLLNVLEVAKIFKIKKIFWPSSIAVFGKTSEKINTPQIGIIEPNSIYGITKLAGERMCEYYFNKYNLDIRSLRLPGLISWKTPPGGGTTDYAVDIFHHAIQNKNYTCFLKRNTVLPMMYIDDAIDAIIRLMTSDQKKITIRTSYNISGISFSPNNLYDEIKKYKPEFKIKYNPDIRQDIADSWPQSLDDSNAREDWNWYRNFDLSSIVKTMFKNLDKGIKINYHE